MDVKKQKFSYIIKNIILKTDTFRKCIQTDIKTGWYIRIPAYLPWTGNRGGKGCFT